MMQPLTLAAAREVGRLSEFGGALLKGPKQMQPPALFALGDTEGRNTAVRF